MARPKRDETKYEHAARQYELYRRRVARAFAEMMEDPDSPRHGGSYAYRKGCPCNCEKCEQRRAAHRAADRAASREYRRREKIRRAGNAQL